MVMVNNLNYTHVNYSYKKSHFAVFLISEDAKMAGKPKNHSVLANDVDFSKVLDLLHFGWPV